METKKMEQNDIFLSTYQEFFDDYNHRFSVHQITEKLLQRAKVEHILEGNEDTQAFYYALAKAQWECGELQSEIFEKVARITSVKEKVLKNFLKKIETPNAHIKLPKRPRLPKAPYKTGECLAYQGENSKWYGSICLRHKEKEKINSSLVIGLRICQDALPTMQDFLQAEVLICSFGSWQSSLDISWHTKRNASEMGIYQIVGKVNIV